MPAGRVLRRSFCDSLHPQVRVDHWRGFKAISRLKCAQICDLQIGDIFIATRLLSKSNASLILFFIERQRTLSSNFDSGLNSRYRLVEAIETSASSGGIPRANEFFSAPDWKFKSGQAVIPARLCSAALFQKLNSNDHSCDPIREANRSPTFSHIGRFFHSVRLIGRE